MDQNGPKSAFKIIHFQDNVDCDNFHTVMIYDVCPKNIKLKWQWWQIMLMIFLSICTFPDDDDDDNDDDDDDESLWWWW